MQSLYPYTPRKMPFEDLESTFVGREQLIDDLITNIREQSGKKALQHWMIIGTRGMGKSHIIAMIYHMVKQEKNLNTSWTPVLMNEEEQGIFSLHTLFIRIVTKLGEELIVENKQISEDITAFINSMRNGNHSKSDIIDYAVSYLKDYVKLSGKKLLVFMENADDVFERYIHKNNEIKQLRNILQQDNFMMLVATSPTFFGGISKNSAPLYDFFRIRRLDLLSFDEAVELLKRWAVLDERINKRKTAAFFDKDDYRLKVLFHLTGGNPRILLFLYMAVTGEEGISNAVDTFSTLLEEDLSNYYLNRMRDLSNQLQPIILALAESEFNLTQKEIARKSFLPMQSIGTAVVRLENDGLVKAVTEKKGKNTLYALTDQLFRLWHQWRTSVHDRHVIGAIVEFLAIWYKKRELLKMAECEDLTGVHCREALGFRATERFKGYWQAFHAESEELVQKYLKKKDYEAFFNTIDLLEETGYKTDDMAFGLINKIEENDGLNKLKIYFSGKIEEHPDEIEPYLGLAGTLFREEEYFEAEEVLKNAITLPSFERKDKKLIAVGWSFFGLARFKQENYAGAEEAFLKAVELEPKNAEYLNFLGVARFKQENYAGTEEACLKVIELEAKMTMIWVRLGVARFKQENYAGAEEAWLKAVELEPKKTEYWVRLGFARFEQENYAGAEEACLKAVELEPKDSEYLNFLGFARFKQENYAGAEEAFSRAIALNPKELNLYSSFAEVFIEAQRPGELIKNLEIMKDVTGLGEDTQAYIHFLMSLAFLFQKDQTPFLKNLKTAVKLADSLESQKKHLLLGELSDFLVELISRDRLETTKQFIGQLKNISQDIASVFNPLNHVIRYFEILFSDEKNVKMVEAKAQRLIDSITSEIKDPVKDMIERVKKNGSRGRPSLSK